MTKSPEVNEGALEVFFTDPNRKIPPSSTNLLFQPKSLTWYEVSPTPVTFYMPKVVACADGSERLEFERKVAKTKSREQFVAEYQCNPVEVE
ncbi:MAG: hypothetical protein WC477_06905 [Patescibacteria group bacterium]